MFINNDFYNIYRNTGASSFFVTYSLTMSVSHPDWYSPECEVVEFRVDNCKNIPEVL
jgi:hypothetical protein